jgi:hypothetical protein
MAPTLCGGHLVMDDAAITKTALQKILDYQMPTGEWGSYKVSLADRYLRVNREEYSRPEFLSLFRKPNGYRTLSAMEVLRQYCGNQYNTRIKRAVNWFKSNLDSGWFVEWDAFASGAFPDCPNMPHVEKAPDIRHTAQALLALLKFDRNPGPELSKGLNNILSHQDSNGMWPRKPGSSSTEILGIVCCVDLLFHAYDHRFRKKLTGLGMQEKFFVKVRLALDRACAWLVKCAEQNDGLWVDEYQTAMVLERLGNWLLSDHRYAGSVEKAALVLLNRKTNEGWTNKSIDDTSIRHSPISRYETTIRVCASLFTIRDKLWFADEDMQPILRYLRDCFKPDVIDASDYRYYIKIFCPESARIEKSSWGNSLFDYLDADHSESKEVQSLYKIMYIWIIDCLERLDRLSLGEAYGLPNYNQAFLEKEKELLSILDSMRAMSVVGTEHELPDSIYQYLQTGDSNDLSQRLQRIAEQNSLSFTNMPSLGQKVYGELKSITIEFFAKFTAALITYTTQ